MKFRKFHKSFLAGLALFILSSLNGCVSGKRFVTLKNSELINTNLKNRHNHEICFNGFSDVRKDNTIGLVQNNRHGMNSVEILALNNVPEWVNKELKTQLKNSGYIINENCTSKGDNFCIGGQIVKVYNADYMNHLGEVTINASITLNSTETLYKTYTGYNKTENNRAATDDVFERSLELSLKSAIDKIITDIDSNDIKTLSVDSKQQY